MKYKKTIVCIALLLMGLTFLIGCVNNEQSTIRMATFPTEDAKEQIEKMEPLRQYLEQELGRPVEIYIASDYSGTIEAMRSKHVEIAWFGPFSYVLASEVAGAEALVGGVRKDTGESSYNSIIITRADTGIETIEDLEGRTFAFLDPASTSGFLVPSNMFKEAGIVPEEYFASIIYAGSHAAVQLAVANGAVDAGADSIPSYNLMVEQGAINPETQKIIWTSDPIPPSPISVRSDLDPELKQQILDIFLSEGAAAITHAEGKMSGYERVYDSDYDGLREIAENLGMNLSEIG